MRSYYCDWCSTAPSISTLNENTHRDLRWDETIKGWSCGNQCWKDDDVIVTVADILTVDIEDDEIIEGEVTLPEV
jgi:hypothetical protein